MRAVQYTKETGGNPDFYTALTLTNLYQEQVFGGYLSTINLTNDSTTDGVQFSFDGATLAGEIRPGESIRINVDQRSSVFVKATAGGDNVRIWGYADISASSVTATFAPLGVVNKTYEGTVNVGNSPITIDFKNDSGRNAADGWCTCDGDGNIQVRFTRDGTTYGDAWTMKKGENATFRNFDIDSLQIIFVVADSNYRVVLV